MSSNIYSISEEAYEKIIEFIEINPDVINSTNLLRKNRSCSYISFILKEIYDYHTKIVGNNYPVYKLRNLYRDLQNSKELLESLKD